MRRYYDDAYTIEFSARVIEHIEANGQPAVILDQTYFYPTGGGQPHDTGTINGIRVMEVISREDGAVVHILQQPLSDDQANCQLDWVRRFDHMQHHTGQHILTQTFVQAADAQTVGFHLSPDTVTIDLDKTGLSLEKIDAAERLANQIIQQNRPVRARIITSDEAEGVRMRKMPEKIYTDGLRVVDIENFDMTACGGTHVAATGEIGLIKIVKVEKRGDKTRIEFLCGNRALQDYREKHAIIGTLTADLICGANEIQQSIARLRDELKNAQQILKSARKTLIQHEVAEILASRAEDYSGARLIIMAFENREAEDIRLLASKLVESGNTIALLGTSGEKAQLVFARSRELREDMSVVLKAALEELHNARGGGRPEMAQGGGVPASLDEIRAALAIAEDAVKT